MLNRLLLATAIIFATHPAIACPPQNVACNVQHVQRVVKQQAVVQYAAPVVNHHAYQQQVNYGHAQQFQHGYAIHVNQVYPQQYWSVGAALQEQAVAKHVAASLKGTAKEILKGALEEVLQEMKAGGRDEPDHREPRGVAVARAKCASCHAAGSQMVADEKAPKLFSGLGEWVGTGEQAAAAVEAARNGSMPKGGPELSNDDFGDLKDYLTVASSPVGK